MANKPVLNIAEAYSKIKASKFNENFDILLDYIEEVSEELTLKVDTINSQLSSSVLSNLQSVYPIGSLYIGITDTCPIANLFGTWEKVADGLCLQGAKGSQVPGETVEAGLPNITGAFKSSRYDDTINWAVVGAEGAFYDAGNSTNSTTNYSGGAAPTKKYAFDASRSNSIYGKSDTVQPPSYLVNIWKRTA
jgi:hypothetical protein